MLVVPAIYLSNGACVSNYKGDSAQSTVLSKNPIAAAARFQNEGATVIHIVDLDGREDSNGKNRALVANIAGTSAMRVQYEDGAASLDDLEELFRAGVATVSLNQYNAALLADGLARYGPDKIAFTIRARKNIVEGTRDVEVMEYAKEIASRGTATIIFRDLTAEGTLHPNFDEIEKILFTTDASVFAFGGIATLDDLKLMQGAGASGVIISRALFEGRLVLGDCIARFRGGSADS